MNAVRLLVACVALASAWPAFASPESASPATKPAALDLDLWTRRVLDNVSVLTAPTTVPPPAPTMSMVEIVADDDRTQFVDKYTSRWFVALPVASRMADVAWTVRDLGVAFADDEARAADLVRQISWARAGRLPPDANTTVWLDHAAGFFGRPLVERWFGHLYPDDRPTSVGGRSTSVEVRPMPVAERLSVAPTVLRRVPESRYETVVRPNVEHLDRLASADGMWVQLERFYLSLAEGAMDRGQRDRASGYLDRLLALLREHPDYRGQSWRNADGVTPGAVAMSLRRAGRTKDVEDWLAQSTGKPRPNVVAGVIGAAIAADDLDAARRTILAERRPHDAAYLLALLDGGEPPEPRDVYWPRTTFVMPDDVVAEIAMYHARRGEVELAARQLEAAMQRVLGSWDWCDIARAAANAGHVVESGPALEHAIAVRAQDIPAEPGSDDAARADLDAWFVREFARLGDIESAASALRATTDDFTPALALATDYVKRGDVAAARVMLDGVVANVRATKRGGGRSLAGAATQFAAIGDDAAAEHAIVEAFDHVDDEYESVEGLTAVLDVARRLGRMDRVERRYATCDVGHRFLLSLAAANLAWNETNGGEANGK